MFQPWPYRKLRCPSPSPRYVARATSTLDLSAVPTTFPHQYRRGRSTTDCHAGRHQGIETQFSGQTRVMLSSSCCVVAAIHNIPENVSSIICLRYNTFSQTRYATGRNPSPSPPSDHEPREGKARMTEAIRNKRTLTVFSGNKRVNNERGRTPLPVVGYISPSKCCPSFF